MAIYHLSVKMIGRTAGRDATAASAYRSGEKIKDERTGLVHNYLSRKNSVLAEEVFMPQKTDWQPSRTELWNAVEMKNKRKDAQTAREIEVALPAELTDEQRWELVGTFSREIVELYEVAADVVIHAPRGDNKNYHAHILLSTDRIDGDGLGNKNREMNGKDELERIRESWEVLTNAALDLAGYKARIDRRTLEKQGIDREATQHEGVAATAMERKGVRTRVREENLRRKALEQEWQEIQQELKDFESVSTGVAGQHDISDHMVEANVPSVEKASLPHRSESDATEKKVPLTEEQLKAEKDKVLGESQAILSKKVGKNSAFITSARTNATYEGKIIMMSENYAVQEVLEGKGILHLLEDNPVSKAALETGKDQDKDISISYDKDGHASVGEKKLDGMEMEEENER